MFEKVGQIAEQLATSVSRRQLLGRLGGAALAAAAAVGGILALPDVAQAAGGVRGPNSIGQCRGKKVGALCGTRNRPGRCAGAPDCFCKLKR